MLLTTRTPYWRAEIQNQPPNVDVVDLDSFNTQKAKGYFAKEFSNAPAKQARAFTFYSELINKVQPPTVEGSRSARLHFANLPLCVGIVAQCVQRETTDVPFSIDLSRGLLWGVLRQLCEREEERQPLKTGARQQLAAFEELTVDSPDATPEFDFDLLGAANFVQEDLPKLISHPLLRYDGEKFRFAYDFLPSFFRAVYLTKFFEDTNRPLEPAAIAIMTAEANGKGVLLDHLRELVPDPAPAVLQTLVRRVPTHAPDLRSFLFHLFHGYAERDSSIMSRADRTNWIFKLLCPTSFAEGRVIAGVHFLGNIERLDLSDMTFHLCQFVDVSFTDSTAGAATWFKNCTFSGDLEFVKTHGWEQVPRPENCTFISPANLAWEKHTTGRVGSIGESVKDAVRFALAKFWKHGRWKASIRRDNWNTGPLAHSKHQREILEAMLSTSLLSVQHISGVPEGGYLF